MLNVFIDTDVVIASLLSSTGAAHFLLNGSNLIKPFISDISYEEIEIVVKRLSINMNKLSLLMENNFQIIKLKYNKDEIKEKYLDFVFDINDTHILCGAEQAKVPFLITYNTKDFKHEKIKRELDINIITPGSLLQFLRNI